ncbi:MAG TPA: PIN domain-containing protein [Solirubrobacteraceae bacterium]|nr:PIN domain-containing protein [Solirubrobacteraceae bacterium]
MALVLDTGVVLAAIEPRDDYHITCSRLLESTREDRIVPAPTLVEIEYLLDRTPQVETFVRFLDDCRRSAFQIEELETADYARVGELLATYADLRVGFVDAAVLAVVERLREPKLATLDHRHFSVMRPRHVEALELLPA